MADLNQTFFEAQTKHAIGLKRVAAGDVRKFQGLLDTAEEELKAKLKTGLAKGMDTTRLRALHQEVKVLRKGVFDKLNGISHADMKTLALSEPAFMEKILGDVLASNMNFAGVDSRLLSALVTAEPFSGGTNAARTLDGWWKGLAAADSRRITDAINQGMIQGETVEQMVKRVQDSMKLTKANATAVVRTASNHVSNKAREQFFKANSEVIGSMMWAATLDGRTTAVCMARDGHYAPTSGTSTKGVPQPWLSPLQARPPAHPQCRSVMVGVLNKDGVAQKMPERSTITDTRTRRKREIDFRKQAKERLGPKKWKAATPAQRNAEIKTERQTWTAENIGRVPGKTTYDSFLRKQSAGFQNEVLGKAKADLFRGGLKLDKYVDKRGKELTLAQLTKKAGLAPKPAVVKPKAAPLQPAWTLDAQKAWQATVTADEQQAFRRWSGNGYTSMRNVQRGRTGDMSDGLLASNRRDIDHINTALDRAPVYNTGETLWRGAPMRLGDFKARMKPGHSFKFDTFASSSTKRSVADDFIRSGQINYPDAESVMFKIRGVQSAGVDISRISNIKGE